MMAVPMCLGVRCPLVSSLWGSLFGTVCSYSIEWIGYLLGLWRSQMPPAPARHPETRPTRPRGVFFFFFLFMAFKRGVCE
ncbi:hypothetical protein VN97_g3278 [Penicillium thymicola]|uniref:Uncharacterized protein n=1 Tax=Penicillium thymicola TaxID=293382 RepID=A0AAI9XAY9_PENTH|nr:hypothetical protein VN97_g3278 [Penicillium thymicola]